MGSVGNGWISITPAPHSIEVGREDAYGGASRDFVEAYVDKFNGAYPTPYSSVSVFSYSYFIYNMLHDYLI